MDVGATVQFENVSCVRFTPSRALNSILKLVSNRLVGYGNTELLVIDDQGEKVVFAYWTRYEPVLISPQSSENVGLICVSFCTVLIWGGDWSKPGKK